MYQFIEVEQKKGTISPFVLSQYQITLLQHSFSSILFCQSSMQESILQQVASSSAAASLFKEGFFTSVAALLGLLPAARYHCKGKMLLRIKQLRFSILNHFKLNKIINGDKYIPFSQIKTDEASGISNGKKAAYFHCYAVLSA